jgi:hypothetical protein
MKMPAFWAVAPCSLVEVDRRFRGAYCLLQHRPEDRQYVPLKRRSTPTRLNGAISQWTVVFTAGTDYIRACSLYCTHYQLSMFDLCVVTLCVGLYVDTDVSVIEAVRSSETLVSTSKSTRRFNPEDQHRIFTTVRISNLIRTFVRCKQKLYLEPEY